MRRVWRPRHQLELHATLAVLRRGRHDPAFRIDGAGAVWRGVRTVLGPGTLCLTAQPDTGEVEARAWGPGAQWLLEQAPAMCGAHDDVAGFVAEHPVLRAAVAAHPGWRIASAGQIVELLVPCVLEQKTTGKQARASWRELVRAHGEPAPGPAPEGLLVPPAPETWAGIPSWDWHRFGVEPARSRTIVGALRYAGRLEETVAAGSAVADSRLRALPGIGVWTSAEIRQRSHGDPDAVSLGDFHLPASVGTALIGRPVDDDGMLELLAPYLGHRYRVCALIGLAGVRAPRRGPRLSIQDHRGH